MSPTGHGIYASPSTFLNFEARSPGEAERVVVASYSVFSQSSPMIPSHIRACNFTNIIELHPWNANSHVICIAAMLIGSVLPL